MDRGAWWAAICGVAQSRTRLKWLSSSCSSIIWGKEFCVKSRATQIQECPRLMVNENQGSEPYLLDFKVLKTFLLNFF